MKINDDRLESWSNHIYKSRLPVLEIVAKNIAYRGEILEIGAGTCWLSAVLSRNPNIKTISAVERDKNRLSLAKDYFIPKFKGNLKKIKLYENDFHVLPFKDQKFDFVVCDAALHHSNNLPKLLIEIRRVMKNDSILVAIREPILPSFPGLKAVKKMTFGLKERIRGDVENTYSNQFWRKSFEKEGFLLSVNKYCSDVNMKEKIISNFPKLNGLIYNRSYLVAHKLKKDFHGKRKK